MLQDKLPFDWDVRVSRRAQRPRITISEYGKVELVWPVNMSQKYMPLMLQEHQDWVMRQLERLGTVEERQVMPPEVILFESLDKQWNLRYQHSALKRLSVKEDGQELLVQGDIQNQGLLREVLCSWVKKQGRLHLYAWLQEEAAGMGVGFESVSIRLQKKRWGSCSAAKRISLNASLLFLPPFLVRHVLIHELTHLNHLNHSPSFWADVQKFDKQYRENRRLLKQYSANIPSWLTESFDTG